MKRHGTKFLNALALLLILLTAHAGKVLHTHPDAYYRTLEQTRDCDTHTAIVDDCPICHFHFFSCVDVQDVLLVTYFSLLGFAPATPEAQAEAAHSDLPSLRGPPLSGTIR